MEEVKYKITTMSVSICLPNHNPVYGDSVTTISIEDDGGGGYIKLQQHGDSLKPGIIKVDVEELKHIVKIATKLLKNYEPE